MNNKEMIDKDGEVRELSKEELKQFKPLSEVNPELLAKIKKGIGQRGPQKSPTKIPISIRVSPEVAEYFRSAGKGWQGRMDNVLKDYVADHK